jgi:signal transduction histidine kinase/putative methionine-R-sulfoxide reductase with GAF domain/CheY-like chemotaxis protein
VICIFASLFFWVNRVNTQHRIKAISELETTKHFEWVRATAQFYVQEYVDDAADELEEFLESGKDVAGSLEILENDMATRGVDCALWSIDENSVVLSNSKLLIGDSLLDRILNVFENQTQGIVLVHDDIPYLLSHAQFFVDDKPTSTFRVIMAVPLKTIYARVDRGNRIENVFTAASEEFKNEDSSIFFLTDFEGKIACRIALSSNNPTGQSDIAGWELIGLGILPLFSILVFLYLLHRYFETLSSHLEILRRILRREKPGVEFFRRDQQVMKSGMPELSEIFGLVDESQGEKAHLKRSIDVLTATLDFIKEKGYTHETINDIVEIIVNLSRSMGGIVFAFDPNDDRLEIAGKVNLADDFLSKFHQTSGGMSFLEFCRKQSARLSHLDLGAHNFDESWKELFSDFEHVFIIPLTLRAQNVGLLILVSLEHGSKDHLRDNFVELISDLLGALVYGLRLEKERVARYDKTRILQETSLAISSTLDLPSVLQIVASRLTEYAGATYCIILLNSEIENLMELASFHTKRQHGIAAPEAGRINLAEFPKISEALSSNRALILGPGESHELTGPEKRFFRIDTAKLLTIIPISHSAKSIGVVVLGEERARPRAMAASDRLNFVQAVVSQAASAIENARLYGYINQRVDQLTALYNVSAVIHSEINIGAMLQKVLAATGEFLHYSSAGVFPVDQNGITQTPYVNTRQGFDISTDRIATASASIVAQVVASNGEAMLIEDMRAESDFHPSFPKMLSELAVPVKFGDKTIGVFSVASSDIRAYDKSDESFLKALASQIAVAMERSRLFEQERERGLKLKTIFEFSRKLSKSLNVNEVIRIATASIQEAFGYHLVSFFQIDHSKKRFYVSHQSSSSEKKLPHDFTVALGDGLLGMAISKRKSVYCPNVRSDPNYLSAVGDVRSEVCVPIVVSEKVFGVLDVESMDYNDFDSEDVSTLEAIGDIMAVAIDNSYLFEETVEKAERLSLIDNINKAISATLDLDSFFRVVARAVADNADYKWTALVVPEGGEFVFKAGYTPQSVGDMPTESALSLLNDRLDSVIKSVVPEFVSFAQLAAIGIPEKLQPIVDAGIMNLALFPIGDTTKAEAVMIVGSARSDGFGRQELALLKDLAVHLRIAWQNAQLYKELKTAYEHLQEAQDRIIQTEKLRALGEMSSGVVHDFNNVLAAILGRIPIILKKLDKFENWTGRQFLEKNLELIEKAANDGAHILSRISEFTKKKPSEKFIELQIDQVIADTIELTKPKWHDIALTEGKSIDVEFHRSGFLQTMGSPSELREVFTNLINNSVDAISVAGKIIIDANLAPENTIVVTVEDTGEGMTPEIRNKIFEPFFTTKDIRGTGLGLSVTYGIITRHKGTIEVESCPGQGSKFTIALPVRKSGQDETRSIEIPVKAEHSGTILVVDDEEQFRDIVVEILVSAGHLVDFAGDGQSALEMLKEKQYEVVVTDLGMSGLSGWELSDAIHVDHPGVRIIMATGWGSNLGRETLAAHHIHGLICKPCKIEEIIKAVNDAICDSRKADSHELSEGKVLNEQE